MSRSIPAALLITASMTLLPAVAHAGSGPWVLGDGEYSIYAGAEAERIERLQIVAGDERSTIDVDEGISTLAGKLIVTVGAQGRFEAELAVPYMRVHANRSDGPVCTSLGLSACATTHGVGVITTRAKGTVLDELYGDPVTWAVGLDLRFGQLTSQTRQRITNLGEGTFDVGFVTSVGRGGLIGAKGVYWSGYVEAAGWYRFPNTRNYTGVDGTVVNAPNPEGSATARMLFGWNSAFSVGPDVIFYARPGGLDFGNLDQTDQTGGGVGRRRCQNPVRLVLFDTNHRRLLGW